MKKHQMNYFTKIRFNMEFSLWIILKSGLLNEKNRIEVRNYFIEKNYALAVKVASSYHRKFIGMMDEEEFVSNALLGLVDAVDKYNICKGVPFKGYALYRIRGEIMDGLRDADMYSRRTRKNKKLIDKAKEELQVKLERDPVREELLEYIGITEKVYANVEKASQSVQMFSIYDDNGEEYLTNEDNPEKAFLDKETTEEIRRAIQKLPVKERLIIKSYYYKGFKSKQVSAIVRLCEQRTRQLHKKAKTSLRRRLKHIKGSM
jgi:RNA polymerase sigma factor for flagellar operon FliA